MTATLRLLDDIDTGCLTKVEPATTSYYDSVLCQKVDQEFYVYPDDTIVCLNYAGYRCNAVPVCGDNEAIFRALFPAYFA